MKSFEISSDMKQNYKLLIGSILPRPIAWVSTLNKDGTNNLAPFSFFTAISAVPMIVAFCPLIRTSTGEKKDTLINIEERKDFVINFISENNVQKANATSAEFDYGQDEFSHAGLTPIDSQLVTAKRVKESFVHFECRLRDILSYGNKVGAGTLIAGEVLVAHVHPTLLDNGRIETKKFKPVGRGAGNDWFKTTDPFQMDRLMKAQIQK